MQDEIGAGKDGDFRGKTLSSLKTWAGIDVPPATPAGPNIPAESAPVLTGISPELLNPGADKSTLDTALKAA